MPEHEITFTRGQVSITIKSSDPELIEKWWNNFRRIVEPDPVPQLGPKK